MPPWPNEEHTCKEVALNEVDTYIQSEAETITALLEGLEFITEVMCTCVLV
jgi:hypothetical protein